MASPTARDLQAENRKNQLIDTALALYAERGVENVSIKDLAAEAKVAQGLIYYYFQSKDELLAAVLQRHNPFPQVQEIVRQLDGLPAEQGLALFARQVSALMLEKKLSFRLLLRELLSPRSSLMAQALPSRQEAVSMMGRYMQQRVAAGELKPHSSELVIDMLVGSLLFLFMGGLPLETLVPQVVATLLDGLRAS